MTLFPDHPAWGLLGLGATLVLAGLAWWAERRRRSRLARYADAALLERLAPASALGAATGRAARRAWIALGLGVALAGPRWGRETVTVRRSGVDVVLAVDASLSMLAPDERPSRLARVKQEIRRLRASGPGDRYALVAFAGRAYLLMPPTTDGGALDLFLDNLDPSVVGQMGSALAPPLRLARDLLQASRSGGDKALVLFSDGEAWDDPAEVHREAAALGEAGVHVVTVGLGTAEGAEIPLPRGERKRDDAGRPVVTRHEPARLAEIAERSGGRFVPADAPDKALVVRREIARLRAEATAATETATRVTRFTWVLWPAFLLLVWDTLAGLPRRRRPVAVAAGLAWVAAVPWPAPLPPSQAPAQGETRALRDVQDWRRRVQAGDRRPVVLYNLGTALLAADSMTAAVEMLEAASRAAPPAVRARALYNLGLAHLRRARTGGDSAGPAAQAAAQVYRQVLLADPADDDARWNYELALRQQPPPDAPEPGQGDGGAGRPDPRPDAPPAALGGAQARRLLDNAARDERETQQRRQRRTQAAEPPRGKDW